MPKLLIRDLDSKTMDALKRRAQEHNTSLQKEAKGILERSAATSIPDFIAAANEIRTKLGKSGKVFSDSTRLVRGDRDR